MKKCSVCNAELKRKHREGLGRFAKRKLCSLKCRQIYITKLRHKNWKPKNCLNCGIEIPRHISLSKYCSQKCAKEYMVGKNCPNWKGGKKIFQGYIQIHSKKHPFCPKGDYMFEHRLIMENWLKENNPNSEFLIEKDGQKYLNPILKIHHKNHNKQDNRIENLEVVSSQLEHFSFNYCPHCPHCNKSGELLENPTKVG